MKKLIQVGREDGKETATRSSSGTDSSLGELEHALVEPEPGFPPGPGSAPGVARFRPPRPRLVVFLVSFCGGEGSSG